MKIRIGISAGGQDLAPAAMVGAGAGRLRVRIRLPVAARGAVAAGPGPPGRPGLGLGRPAPDLKIGTTMLLPGRNLVWLAKAVATLDLLSGGRFLLTFVPGPVHRR